MQSKFIKQNDFIQKLYKSHPLYKCNLISNIFEYDFLLDEKCPNTIIEVFLINNTHTLFSFTFSTNQVLNQKNFSKFYFKNLKEDSEDLFFNIISTRFSINPNLINKNSKSSITLESSEFLLNSDESLYIVNIFIENDLICFKPGLAF
ncbi:hypothetical protein H3N56_11475 [Cetobacterium sp. 2A]|uniref:hypothetical protein n=1 Tax=Cetobacterium sp. 2A TaxID=2754723 RepID=UPI00163C3371|nr:hypothetical protein [Cetobacterium sp. 2A]MBC2857052.1 hypothetical protein [Cetobacterium sp. 2A]